MPDPTTEVTLDGPELEELGSVSAGFSVWDAVILFALVLLSMAVLGPLLLTGRTLFLDMPTFSQATRMIGVRLSSSRNFSRTLSFFMAFNLRLYSCELKEAIAH